MGTRRRPHVPHGKLHRVQKSRAEIQSGRLRPHAARQRDLVLRGRQEGWGQVQHVGGRLEHRALRPAPHGVRNASRQGRGADEGGLRGTVGDGDAQPGTLRQESLRQEHLPASGALVGQG